MSKQTITKEVTAVVCDFCDEEIDVKSRNYCYYQLPSYGDSVIELYKYRIKHILFYWDSPKKKDYVRYDFHAGCFDKLMTGFLKEKGKEGGERGENRI